MLNRKFTAREAAVILILVAVILGYFYYYVVYQYFENEQAKYDLAQVEEDIEFEQMKIARLQNMESELEEKGPSTAVLGVYNNQSEELNALAGILEGKATGISMNWGDPELNGKIVRRDVTISFNTGNFEEAGDIIKEIADCEYTLLIVDMSLYETEVEEEIEVTSTSAAVAVEDEAEGEADVETETSTQPQTETVTVTKKVTSVTVTVRFFETTDGAENLNGLTLPAPEISIDEDEDGLPSTAELNDQINGD